MTSEELAQFQTQDFEEFPIVVPKAEQSILTNAGRVALAEFLNFVSAAIQGDVEAVAAAKELVERLSATIEQSKNTTVQAANTAAAAMNTALAKAAAAENSAARAVVSENNSAQYAQAANAAKTEANEILNTFLLGKSAVESLQFKLEDGRQLKVVAVIENGSPTFKWDFAETLSETAFKQIRMKTENGRFVILKGVIKNGIPSLDWDFE